VTSSLGRALADVVVSPTSPAAAATTTAATLVARLRTKSRLNRTAATTRLRQTHAGRSPASASGSSAV